MREHTLPVTRTARFLTLGSTDRPIDRLWYCFHGYGELAAQFAPALSALDDGASLVVVPEGLSRFYRERGGRGDVGASWMTREGRDQEIGDYLGYLDALHAHIQELVELHADVRIGVLGFSQGAATAARWSARGSIAPKVVVIWGGDVPPDLDLDAARARWQTAYVAVVAGRDDHYITEKIANQQVARLTEHAIASELIRFEGGHHLNSNVLERLREHL